LCGWRRLQTSLLSLCLLVCVSGEANDSENCIRLETVRVASSPVLGASTAEELTDPFVGNCIDAVLMREMLAIISGYIIEQGFITTRPYLLEQDISDGEIEIEILVGKVEAVVDADSGAGNASIAMAFAFNGDILNLRQLENSLEAIERPRSVQASFEIQPGVEQGGSIIEIDSDRSSPFSAELGVNARTDVDEQLSFYLALDNLFNINDIIELRYNSGDVFQAYQSDRSRELEYSLSLGANLISLLYSDLNYRQRLQGIGGSFVSERESIRQQLRISRPLSRSGNYRLRLGFTLALEDNENSFEGEPIEVSSYRTSKAAIDLHHDWFASWGQLSSSIVYQQGLDSYGARDDDDVEPEAGIDNSARLQFSKTMLATQAYVYLPDRSWYFDLRLHLQYSPDLLYASDKLFVGSENTVRGYTYALSGSNGGYTRSAIVKQWQAVNNPFNGKSLTKSIALSLGFDYGTIDCEIDNPDLCGEIYSFAAGLTVADDNFYGLLSWGRPLRELDDGVGSKDIYLLDFRWRL